MFDIGWTEMMVIAMLALIIIGPKDLPGTLRTVGQWVRKARSLAREFQSGVDEMVREAELDDARKALEATKGSNLTKQIAKAVDPDGELNAEAKALERSTRPVSAAEDAKADGTKSGASKSGASAGLDKTANSDSKTGRAGETSETDAEAGASDGSGAKVVTHPARVAPGNSVRPPKDEFDNGQRDDRQELGGATASETATENSKTKAGGSAG